MKRTRGVKRLAGALLALVMVLGMVPGTVRTAEAATAEQIKSQITATYKTALSRSGRSSFNGYCATYVNWQLVILGINTSYVGGNGNDEYDNYKNKSNSSGGYSVAAYPATNYSVLSALNTITENGSKDAYNILIGFEKSIYGDGVTYGHTCFIHAILNGKVYYSESSQWTIDGAKVSEGTPIVQSISSFAELYRSSNFTLDGVIHFGGTAPQPPDYIAAGTYYLRNKTAAYLNADGTANKSNLSVTSLKTVAAQRFVVSGGTSNSISASFDATLRVNPFSDTPTSGTNVNLYSGTEIGSDMHWCFEAVSGGYIIHNFSYPSLVLGLDGTNVRVETKSGASDQIWELIPATYTIYYNALGGSGAPAAQTKKFSENLTLSAAKPTLSGYTFKGWATTANAAAAQYQPGGTYTGNGNATLYAVWEKESEPVTLTGITVASTPTKTVYEIGEALDTAGLTLTAAYSDGSTKTVTEGYTVSGFDSAAAGEKTVTVTYEGKTVSFTVTVKEATAPVEVGENDRQAAVESAGARPGETVTLTVTLKNAEPIRSIAASNITCDTAALTLTGVEWAVKDPVLKTWNREKGNGALTMGELTDLNGAVLTLTFAVKDDAGEGDYAVGLTLAVNSGGDNEAVPVIPGTLSVRRYLPGDLDGDERVTDADAIYLLMNTFFPEDYPVSQPCDFDGDGRVTDADAIWLLMFTFFPEDYPIGERA